MRSFEASFEGVAFDEASFDVHFFLQNAREIVEEHEMLRRERQQGKEKKEG